MIIGNCEYCLAWVWKIDKDTNKRRIGICGKKNCTLFHKESEIIRGYKGIQEK